MGAKFCIQAANENELSSQRIQLFHLHQNVDLEKPFFFTAHKSRFSKGEIQMKLAEHYKCPVHLTFYSINGCEQLDFHADEIIQFGKYKVKVNKLRPKDQMFKTTLIPSDNKEFIAYNNEHVMQLQKEGIRANLGLSFGNKSNQKKGVLNLSHSLSAQSQNNQSDNTQQYPIDISPAGNASEQLQCQNLNMLVLNSTVSAERYQPETVIYESNDHDECTTVQSMKSQYNKSLKHYMAAPHMWRANKHKDAKSGIVNSVNAKESTVNTNLRDAFNLHKQQLAKSVIIKQHTQPQQQNQQDGPFSFQQNANSTNANSLVQENGLQMKMSEAREDDFKLRSTSHSTPGNNQFHYSSAHK